MTDRGIIFSAPMVRALIDGRKTQTRRLATSPLRRCVPGDRLWVRETAALGDKVVASYRADPDAPKSFSGCDWAELYGRGYPESCRHYSNAGMDCCRASAEPLRFTPSIHMPRWASRLTLIVEAVRVEPLQAISAADCYAEGIERPAGPMLGNDVCARDNARNAYRSLWTSLHGPDSWEANPAVVAITFRVVKANIDKLAEVA